MKPFVLPAWRKPLERARARRQDRVVGAASAAIEAILKRAVEQVISDAMHGLPYHEPRIALPMRQASARFYRAAITQGWRHAEQEKKLMPGRKTLSAGIRIPKGNVPKLPELVEIFRDRRAWPRIMKRSDSLADRMRKAYLRKLRVRFAEIVPRLLSGETTPERVKSELMDAWQTSRSRVESLFRTETTRYFAQTQVAFFEQEEDIIGFLFDSVRDVARTDVCRSRHGLVYRPGTELLRKNTPACHWNCRSHLIALANTEFNRKLLEDPKRDPMKVSVAPLPPGWNK